MSTKKELLDKYPDLPSIIKRVRVLIKNDDLTQEAFCKKVGISRGHLSKVLTHNAILSGDMLLKFAKAGYDITWLLTGNSSDIDRESLEKEIERLTHIVDELFQRMK